jgi:AraC-like DNA-binding protein
MPPRETTAAASVVNDMLHYLEARGVPRTDASAAAGLTQSFPASADERVRGSQLERLWRFAVERTGDPIVGLHMGEGYNPGTLDILGFVILNCATVGEVLSKFARYSRVLNDGMRIEIAIQGTDAHIRCSFLPGVDNYLHRMPEQAMAATWAGVARELGRLPATPVVARDVWFSHAAPAEPARREYERVIGAPVRFGATEDRFTIAAADLERPLRSANPALLQVFERHADTVLSSFSRPDTRASQVTGVLLRKLKGAAPTLDEVAREMAMSTRNLQRALRDSGTTYQALLDETRRELALQHLADPSSSAAQVGFLLGFSEPSAFHRAFRRWTGHAPSAYRALRGEHLSR